MAVLLRTSSSKLATSSNSRSESNRMSPHDDTPTSQTSLAIQADVDFEVRLEETWIVFLFLSGSFKIFDLTFIFFYKIGFATNTVANDGNSDTARIDAAG
jgi:hypothetical protein